MSSADWNFPQPQRPHSRRRHANERGHQSSPLAIILLILLIMAMVAGGLWWVFLRNGGSGSSLIGDAGKPCEGEQVKLTVVLPPDIHPIVHAAAQAVHDEGSGCDFFGITDEAPSQTATKLATGHEGDVKAEAWIPDSSAWLAQAAVGSQKFPTQGRSVARSPLVLVMPNQDLATKAVSVAAAVQKQADQARGNKNPTPIPTTPEAIAQGTRSWLPYSLAANAPEQNKVAFASSDPRTSTAGMLSVLTYPQAFMQMSTSEGIALMQTLHFKGTMQPNAASMEELFNGLKQGNARVFPALEQQAFSFAAANPGTPMAVVYPQDKVALADYPLVASNGLDATRADMARRLAEKLASPQMNSAWLDKGFRPASGNDQPSTPAFAPQPLQGKPSQTVAIDPRSVPAQVNSWVNYNQEPFNVLVLIDQSGSMNKKVTVNGVTMTKADLLREAGYEAGQLFGSDTTLGIWLFGSPDDSEPTVEGLPYGPMNEIMPDGKTRREEVAVLLSKFRAGQGTGGRPLPTPLYQATLDGITFMQQHVDPKALTIVVPLTDGTDEGSQFSMHLQQYLNKYKEIEDPSRRVVLFPIAFGDQADVQSLQAMATASLPQGAPATLNKVSVAKQPTDLAEAIAQVFIAVRAPEVARLRQQQAGG